MELTDLAKLKAQKTYDTAADLFDAHPLGFWARYGEHTVVRLRLKPGATVLDVACGTGASAVPLRAADVPYDPRASPDSHRPDRPTVR